MITKLQENSQNSNNEPLVWMRINNIEISRMCIEILRWMGKLEDSLPNPEPLERFIEFAKVSDSPFQRLSHVEGCQQ